MDMGRVMLLLMLQAFQQRADGLCQSQSQPPLPRVHVPPHRTSGPPPPPELRGGLTLVMSGDDDHNNESHDLLTSIRLLTHSPSGASRLAARRSHSRTRPSFWASLLFFLLCSLQPYFAMACSTWAEGGARACGLALGQAEGSAGRRFAAPSHSSPSSVPPPSPVPGSSTAARCLLQNGRDAESGHAMAPFCLLLPCPCATQLWDDHVQWQDATGRASSASG